MCHVFTISFQDGKTPEFYQSNRDELSHGELLDYVKGKFSFDTDAPGTGKQSSVSM